MKIVEEFKKFALKGNVVDMAIGIIIGTAFGRIVTSLLNDILMPPIGMALGGVDFTDLKIVIKEGTVDQAGKAVSAVTVNYGNFIQVTLDFIIVAFITFMIIKAMNKMMRKEVEAPAPPAPTVQEKLLAEIRDLLKK
jgi:large conductance mechanosensitive channel